MEYTKYNPITGEILSTGILQIECIEFYQPCILEKGDFITQYVDIDNKKLIKKPLKPSEFHIFDYSSKEWVIDRIKQIENIKKKRNALLLESDWTQVLDSPLSAEKKAEWAVYRQALRDITNQDPNLVVFPDKP